MRDHWIIRLLFGFSYDRAQRAKDLGKVYLGLVLTIGLTVVIGIAAWGGARGGLPDESALVVAEGLIERASVNRDTIDIALSNRTDKFRYLSKGGASSSIFPFLLADHEARLWHEPTASDYVAGNDALKVFQIEVDGHMVRSYAQVEENWIADNQLMPWLLGGCIAGMIYFVAYLWLAGRRRI